MYEQSCELIYSMISARLVYRKKALGLTNDDIHPDHNLVSAIAHNRRHPKKNKYLLPERALYPETRDETISEMAKNLGFDSDNEFIWGNAGERDAYAGDLFLTLLNDATETEDPGLIHSIDAVLGDYIPYGVSLFYDELYEMFRGSILRADRFVPLKFRADSCDVARMRERAIARLYGRVEPEFRARFDIFCLEAQSTLKLNKKLSMFVTELVLPLIQATITEDSIGADVRMIMLRNYKRLGRLENSYYRPGEPIGFPSKSEKDGWIRGISLGAARAGDEYIERLTMIQRQCEPAIREISNEWHPQMCMTTNPSPSPATTDSQP